jgi:hypothetical protein
MITLTGSSTVSMMSSAPAQPVMASPTYKPARASPPFNDRSDRRSTSQYPLVAEYDFMAHVDYIQKPLGCASVGFTQLSASPDRRILQALVLADVDSYDLTPLPAHEPLTNLFLILLFHHHACRLPRTQLGLLRQRLRLPLRMAMLKSSP